MARKVNNQCVHQIVVCVGILPFVLAVHWQKTPKYWIYLDMGKIEWIHARGLDSGVGVIQPVPQTPHCTSHLPPQPLTFAFVDDGSLEWPPFLLPNDALVLCGGGPRPRPPHAG